MVSGFPLSLSLVDLLLTCFCTRLGVESPIASSASVQSFPPRHPPFWILLFCEQFLPGFNSGASQLCIYSSIQVFIDLVPAIVIQSGLRKAGYHLKSMMGPECDVVTV